MRPSTTTVTPCSKSSQPARGDAVLHLRGVATIAAIAIAPVAFVVLLPVIELVCAALLVLLVVAYALGRVTGWGQDA